MPFTQSLSRCVIVRASLFLSPLLVLFTGSSNQKAFVDIADAVETLQGIAEDANESADTRRYALLAIGAIFSNGIS